MHFPFTVFGFYLRLSKREQGTYSKYYDQPKNTYSGLNELVRYTEPVKSLVTLFSLSFCFACLNRGRLGFRGCFPIGIIIIMIVYTIIAGSQASGSVYTFSVCVSCLRNNLCL
jgi:hypothetical protein